MRSPVKWSVTDYHHIRDLGILDQRRCELINGEIWDMSPEGESHRFVNHRGVKYLRQVMAGKAEIFEAHPITLTESEPEPDIAIVHLPDTRYLKHHPYPEDIYWLIEVADATLSYDLNVKRQLYAKAGIPEYWVIDVPGRQLVMFKDLQSGDYRAQSTVSSGTVHPMAFPDVAVAVPKLVSIPNLE